MQDPKLEFLTPENSILLLVDYQPGMFKGLGSGDQTDIKNAAVASAKAAQILGVPTVLSSIHPEGNGEFLKEISELFPGQEVFSRKVPSFNALEDEATLAALKASGRKKVVIAGLWTSMCFCFTAMGALAAGFEVYGIMDALGDATKEAHHFGIKRALQVGVVPITWMSLTSEWMHDWGNPKAGEITKEIYAKYDAMLGM